MRIEQANKRVTARKSTSDYFTVIDTVSGQAIGRLVDISLNGFKIISADNLGEGSYECLISFPRMIGNVRDIPLKATLKWCQHNRRWDWYEAGFQIDQLSEHARGVLDLIMGEID